MPEKSIAILSSAYRNFRTKDVENPYRQNSDFLYMSVYTRSIFIHYDLSRGREKSFNII